MIEQKTFRKRRFGGPTLRPGTKPRRTPIDPEFGPVVAKDWPVSVPSPDPLSYDAHRLIAGYRMILGEHEYAKIRQPNGKGARLLGWDLIDICKDVVSHIGFLGLEGAIGAVEADCARLGMNPEAVRFAVNIALGLDAEAREAAAPKRKPKGKH